jgi:hypothetical protein
VGGWVYGYIKADILIQLEMVLLVDTVVIKLFSSFEQDLLVILMKFLLQTE